MDSLESDLDSKKTNVDPGPGEDVLPHVPDIMYLEAFKAPPEKTQAAISSLSSPSSPPRVTVEDSSTLAPVEPNPQDLTKTATSSVDVGVIAPGINMAVASVGTSPFAIIQGTSATTLPSTASDEIGTVHPVTHQPEHVDMLNHTVDTPNAWSKPLSFSQPPSAATVLMRTTKDLLADLAMETHWPSLAAAKNATTKRRLPDSRSKSVPQPVRKLNDPSNLPVAKLPPPALKEDGSYRFPWAAKLNPDSRNLYRPLNPTYLQDGTPKITIPEHVFLHGPENHEEYIVGHFHRCVAPPGGLVHAVVNRLWGRNGRITAKKISDNSYLFHIPDMNTRKWVLQRVLWHIDDCLLFVAPAPTSSSPAFTIPELTSIPVWVTLSNIPDTLYSRIGISHIASGLGEPMLTHRPRLDPSTLGTAKLMVEVELDKAFPQKIALDDETGNTLHMVNVEYAWIPTKCSRCGQLGHKEKRCLISATTNIKTALEDTRKTSHTPTTTINQLPHDPSTSLATETTGTISTVGASSPLQFHPGGEAIPIEAIESQMIGTSTASEDGPHIFQSTTQASVLPDLATPLVHTSTPTGNINTEDISSSLATEETSLVAEVVTPQITKTMELHHSINNVPTNNHHSATVIEAASTALVKTSTPSTHHKGNTDLMNEDVSLEQGISLLENRYSILQKTSRGREIKPSQKMQEMEWTTVTRGRGRRGRGGTSH